MIEVTHVRTLEAAAKCRHRGSCHDCAMVCPYGNTIHNERGEVVPCGSDVYDAGGHLVICGQCRAAWGEN